MLSRDSHKENVSLKYLQNIYQMLEHGTLLVHGAGGWCGGN